MKCPKCDEDKTMATMFLESLGASLGTTVAWTFMLWLFWPVWKNLIDAIASHIK